MIWNEAANAAASDLPDNSAGKAVGENVLTRLLLDDSREADSIPQAYDANTTLVKIEIVDHSAGQSFEPLRETSYNMPKPDLVKAHSEIGQNSEKLQVGGTIRRSGNGIDIELSDKGRAIHIDTVNGASFVDSEDRLQKEVRFFNSPWEETVLTNANGLRLTFSGERLKSIQKDNVEDLFLSFSPKHVGSTPRLPSNQDLLETFTDAQRNDLKQDLAHIEAEKKDATHAMAKGNVDAAGLISAKASLDLGLLLEKTANIDGAHSVELNASAESELRSALNVVRNRYGAGTPETVDYANALNRHLASIDSVEMKDEIERLSFESRRAALMSKSIKNVEAVLAGASDKDNSAQQLRASLISIHIAGGDSGLKSFVEDLNKRLSGKTLKAPNETPGLARHGAIIWTPEGSTRYSGSFDIN